MFRNKKIIIIVSGFLLLGAGFVLGASFKGAIFVRRTEKETFSQEPFQESPPALKDEDRCGQAKYQEACEARPDCIWIGCPNNVCVLNR